MALTDVNKVRLLTNISTTDVSNEDMCSIIDEATKEIMSQVNVRVVRERIEYIDGTRENDIDGTNTTYYVKNWKGKYISDADFNGYVDDDDITVYAVASDDTETEAAVSSVTSSEGKFVLSTAYNSSYDLYVSYSYTYFDPVTPDPLLGLAATYLAASYAYLKRDAGITGYQRFGNVTINTSLSATYGEYYKKYLDLMKKINSYGGLSSNWKESKVRI